MIQNLNTVPADLPSSGSSCKESQQHATEEGKKEQGKEFKS